MSLVPNRRPCFHLKNTYKTMARTSLQVSEESHRIELHHQRRETHQPLAPSSFCRLPDPSISHTRYPIFRMRSSSFAFLVRRFH